MKWPWSKPKEWAPPRVEPVLKLPCDYPFSDQFQGMYDREARVLNALIWKHEAGCSYPTSSFNSGPYVGKWLLEVHFSPFQGVITQHESYELAYKAALETLAANKSQGRILIKVPIYGLAQNASGAAQDAPGTIPQG